MIYIRLTEECNFKCIFCHIPQLKPKKLSLMDVLKIVMLVDHSVPNTFSISGGEPTKVSYLIKLIKFIKKCNKNHYINIETNGFFLSNYSYTKELIDSGLNSILLSFHSHKEEIFEKITGIKNSFGILKKTFSVLNQFSIDVEVSLVLCKYNYKDLNETIMYLNQNLNYNGLLLGVIFEKINYNSIKDFHVLIPKIEKPLNDAYNLIEKSRKKIDTCGIPMCFIKNYEYAYCSLQYEDKRYYKKDQKCNNCHLNLFCRGVPGEYADLYGTSFVKPIISGNKKLIKKLSLLNEEYCRLNNIKFNNSGNINN